VQFFSSKALKLVFANIFSKINHLIICIPISKKLDASTTNHKVCALWKYHEFTFLTISEVRILSQVLQKHIFWGINIKWLESKIKAPKMFSLSKSSVTHGTLLTRHEYNVLLSRSAFLWWGLFHTDAAIFLSRPHYSTQCLPSMANDRQDLFLDCWWLPQ